MNHSKAFFQGNDDQRFSRKSVEKVDPTNDRIAEPYASLVDAWNEFNEDDGVHFHDFEMNGMVRFQVDELWKVYPDIETFRTVFREAAENPIKSGKRVVPWQLEWVVRPKNFRSLLASSKRNHFGIRERFIPKSEWDPVYHPKRKDDWDPVYHPKRPRDSFDDWFDEQKRRHREWEAGPKRWPDDDEELWGKGPKRVPIEEFYGKGKSDERDNG